MELGLSLGDPSKPLEKSFKKQKTSFKNGGFDFCIMGLGLNNQEIEENYRDNDIDDLISEGENSDEIEINNQELNLLPLSPVSRLGLNRFPVEEVTSANRLRSQFHLGFSVGGKRGFEEIENDVVEEIGNDVVEVERAASDDDDDEIGLSNRKKLRLSKQQSAFLEDSFKEHSTLNPKQKVALAKQLSLRPRQVEVWFQNRRARTKLKQTEIDYEYMKRCSETLADENRRLQKELQELRALKNSNPFYMQSPATTLTMCPSCERVSTTTSTGNGKIGVVRKAVPFPVINRSSFFPIFSKFGFS
ncbi:Homeobox-leucine zipper protein [Castilleja foliolosa]|uniref:Homeobox-leucine zipper protein n=1 Tax=Castilleja foliolosa TaxID=1961234 RepID=A0ABD3C468_9LAMI